MLDTDATLELALEVEDAGLVELAETDGVEYTTELAEGLLDTVPVLNELPRLEDAETVLEKAWLLFGLDT